MRSFVPWKVTKEMAYAIRTRYAAGETIPVLEKAFSLSRGAISDIIRGIHPHVRGWTNISRGRGRPRRKAS